MDTHKELAAMLRRTAPLNFRAFLSEITHIPSSPKTAKLSPKVLDYLAIQHLQVGHLYTTVLPEDISTSFLSESAPALEQRKEFLKSLAESCLTVGRLAMEICPQQDLVRILPCMGCNMPYDNVDDTDVEHGFEHTLLQRKERVPLAKNRQSLWYSLTVHAHIALVLMRIAIEILRQANLSQSSTFLNHMAPDVPARYSNIFTWVCEATIAHKFWEVPLCLLIGLVDNCTTPFPKIAHTSVSLISLTLSRRPAAAIAIVDVDEFPKMLHSYLRYIFNLVKESHCLAQSQFGVIQLINALPMLYYLGEWAEGRVGIVKYRLSVALATLAINFLHQITRADPIDSAPDIQTFPELVNAPIDVEECFSSSTDIQQLIRTRPQTFAAACLIEIVGRWQVLGIPISAERVPAVPSPEVAATLSRRQIREYTEPVGDMFREYIPKLNALITELPRLAYLGPIATALATFEKPPLPKEDISFVRGPLGKRLLCTNPSCDRNTAKDSEGPLKSCGGGCKGMARYCSVKHQKAHWPQHKLFCNRQKAALEAG